MKIISPIEYFLIMLSKLNLKRLALCLLALISLLMLVYFFSWLLKGLIIIVLAVLAFRALKVVFEWMLGLWEASAAGGYYGRLASI
ncbi:hypothetical protein KO507_13315 [Gilvimarinus agarilyticus]|uniref:hypothetical protein n=1 Tax=Gilvimarinus sp. 2_MG-2023 TaxID=3062666 RepID=UPI001C08B3EB|nr:hypothetical protein [Gilvimarinus sp. 2_MG-2023]MBU2886747.1 hypothetical protein [Gilvimarinus agarilyticus]MDO6571412.1 hypothetical protein [Gilvimarinus sp. 2_MG-2023]